MKIAMYVLIALLVVTLGAAALFYFSVFTPLVAEHARMQLGMTELDKAKVELKKYKEKEAQETAWIGPIVEVMSAGLAEEIKTGTAEVLATGGKVVINIAEQAIYMPGSYTFSQESLKLRSNLAALIKNDQLKGKDIYIGNTTAAVAAQKKGKKKIPGKDARTLAAERSAVLIRDFVEKHNVNQDAIIALAYSAKQPETGFKIKDHKTVIVIEKPSTVAAKNQAAPAPAAKAATAPAAAATPAQPKPIPIQPAQPKTK
jgi:hypothetical protein